MAVLHGSLTGKERDGQAQKRGEGSPPAPAAQVTTVMVWGVLTASKTSDVSRGADQWGGGGAGWFYLFYSSDFLLSVPPQTFFSPRRSASV